MKTGSVRQHSNCGVRGLEKEFELLQNGALRSFGLFLRSTRCVNQCKLNKIESSAAATW